MPRATTTQLSVELLEGREVPATIFAVNSAGRLLTFDSSNPSVLIGNLRISGLASNEHITDIDVRPGTGGLYGRSDLGRLYVINTFSGFATGIGVAVPTSSRNVAIDFDPTSDQLRITGNNTINYAINPNTGQIVAAGANLAYRAGDFSQGLSPRITGLAYTGGNGIALATTLYGIDHIRNTLVAIGNSSANDGQVRTLGSLGFDAVANIGFDIDSSANTGYASLQQVGTAFSRFYIINLNTGTASLVGTIGPNRLIYDIAVARGFTVAGGSGFAAPTNTSPVFTTPSPAFTTPTPSFTTPLFPTLVQPLATGLVSPAFAFTTTTTTSTTPNFFNSGIGFGGTSFF